MVARRPKDNEVFDRWPCIVKTLRVHVIMEFMPSHRSASVLTPSIALAATLAAGVLAAQQPSATTAPPSQRSSDVTIRGCLTGSKLTQIETDSKLNLPDTLAVSSIKVIRSQVKALSGHRVELIGRVEGVPGQETGTLIASSDHAKIYLGGGDPSLGSDLGVGRPETPGIYAKTIKDLAPTCDAASAK